MYSLIGALSRVPLHHPTFSPCCTTLEAWRPHPSKFWAAAYAPQRELTPENNLRSLRRRPHTPVETIPRSATSARSMVNAYQRPLCSRNRNPGWVHVCCERIGKHSREPCKDVPFCVVSQIVVVGVFVCRRVDVPMNRWMDGPMDG